MDWKTKRLIGTAVWAIAPYLAMSFIAFDFAYAFSDPSGRCYLLIGTAFCATMAYTYPRWAWK